MISKENAHKLHGRNVQVINRGDPGWKSDRHDRRGESYGTNPTSKMDQHIRRNARGPVEPDIAPEFPIGYVTLTDDGADAWEWVVAPRGELGRYWRLRATHRNGAR